MCVLLALFSALGFGQETGGVVSFGATGFSQSASSHERNIQVAAGGSHTILLKAGGTVVCWGRNSSGQCNVPAGLSGVVQVAGGLSHTIALKADGTVVCWGDNSSGQSTVPAGLTGVVQVAGGDYHTIALKADGTVVCWGDNSFSQCTVPVGLTGVVMVAGGFSHTIALKADGTAVCWGDNSSRQRTVPVGLTGVVQVAGGLFHTIALKAGGTVVCWGRNSSRQSTVPAGLTGVVKVAGGSDHTIALKSDGTVNCWGDNASGQCTVPAGLTGVAQVAGGYAHTIALKAVGAYSDLQNVPIGTASVGHLTLTLPSAPKNSVSVNLQSDSAAVTVPATVSFSAGQRSKMVTVSIGAGLSAAPHLISASYHGAQALVSFGAVPLRMEPLRLTRLLVMGGTSLQGTIKFNMTAPGSGYLVSLTSSNPNVIVPKTVTVTAGQDQITFPITTKEVTSNIGSRITATIGGLQSQAILAVRAVLLSVNPTVLLGGTDTTGKITLSKAAPAGGLVVSLTSDNAAAQLPATLTVPAGAKEATFKITTSKPSSSTPVTIKAQFASNAVAVTRLLVK